MGFHHDWHDAQIRRGPRFFEEAEDEPSVDQLLTVLAALKGVPKVSARPEFVAGLRERLLAEAVTRPSAQETAPQGGGGGSAGISPNAMNTSVGI